MTFRQATGVLSMNDHIRDALSNPDNNLPEIEKNILLLLYVEGKTLDEIAAQLALRRERVRQLKQKALRRLELIKL
jgi:RNA polymerase sigma factor (sigma-70 family)